MSPELYFILTLIVRMAVTAAFLLAATVTAERAGPLVGGLVATLPISAGPVQAPLVGLGFGFVAVHFLAMPLGVWWSYLIALAIGLAWNALLWLARTRRMQRA